MTGEANMDKVILLNFDLEEFNLPLEYGAEISKKEQFEFSFLGFERISKLLRKNQIKSTFFVTASFASKYPKIIRDLENKGNEIASHSLHHNIREYDEQETGKSKEVIEKIIGKKIEGFRFPRLRKLDFDSLKRLGFKYDSSICPTYLPRRYNNYSEKREITLKNRVFEVPISVMPIIHFPLYWIFFRSLGLNYSKAITLSCVRNPGYTNIFFHPWEFNDLSKFKIPFYIKRNSGEKALEMLKKYIIWCKKRDYRFSTIISYLKALNKL